MGLYVTLGTLILSGVCPGSSGFIRLGFSSGYIDFFHLQ